MLYNQQGSHDNDEDSNDVENYNPNCNLEDGSKYLPIIWRTVGSTIRKASFCPITKQVKLYLNVKFWDVEPKMF